MNLAPDKTTGIVVTVIVSLITALSALVGLSSHFVAQGEFIEYKKGRVEAVDKRLDRIETKLDTLIEMKGRR